VRPPWPSLLLLVAACGAPGGAREVTGPGGPPPPAKLPRGAFVVAEHAAGGAHLVLIDETGRRVRDLTDVEQGAVDAMPSFSPDGRWVAFASSRGHPSPRETALWIVAADGSAPPRRLLEGDGVDITPAFAPDRLALAFGSTRGGDLDVWTVELDDDPGGPRAGALHRVTDSPRAEYQPAWSHAGDALAWTAQAKGGVADVMLGDRDGGGARRLVAGASPAFAPGDDAVVFAAPTPGRAGTDLWLVPRAGGEPRPLTDDPLIDESAPRFTPDGRFVVATAIVHDGGRALAATIVCIELADPAHRVRALMAPIPTSRLGVDPVPGPIDETKLRQNPLFTEALRRAVIR
jgi:Tol biopolymer transport system component